MIDVAVADRKLNEDSNTIFFYDGFVLCKKIRNDARECVGNYLFFGTNSTMRVVRNPTSNASHVRQAGWSLLSFRVWQWLCRFKYLSLSMTPSTGTMGSSPAKIQKNTVLNWSVSTEQYRSHLPVPVPVDYSTGTVKYSTVQYRTGTVVPSERVHGS